MPPTRSLRIVTLLMGFSIDGKLDKHNIWDEVFDYISQFYFPQINYSSVNQNIHWLNVSQYKNRDYTGNK